MLETHHDAEPILVSPRQALRLLDISNSSLYGLLRSGQLPSLHVGRSRRIPLAAIKAFVTNQLAANPSNKKRPGRPRKPQPVMQPSAADVLREIEA